MAPCGVLLAVVAVAATATAQMPPARVVVDEVVQQKLERGHTFAGTVVPLRRSVVGSPLSDRVVELLVEAGDSVGEGDPLARLRTTQLEIELAGAKAELELRRQELAELENGTRPEEIRQAEARMLAAKALMEFTQSRLRRAQTLFERNATSEDDLQDATSTAEAAAQKFYEAKAAHEMAVAGPRTEDIAQARASLLMQQEAVRRLEDDIAEHTIVAPFDGYVTKEHTEVGQWMGTGDPVVEMIEVDQVEVDVPVLESFMPRLEIGESARVEVDALAGRTFSGEVMAIVPQADVRSRSFPVKVRLDNPSQNGRPLLRPGMFARVTFAVGEPGEVLLVPKDAVVLGGQSPMVWTVQPDPKAKKGGPAHVAQPVPVELGASQGGLIEVRGPLQPGQRVVRVGNERLQPGQAVILTEPNGNGAPRGGKPSARTASDSPPGNK
jgi:RND family efflux transporter MFP subunit